LGRRLDQTQLAACETPGGEECISLTEPKFIDGCGNEAAVLDPAFAGDYLRIADIRYGPGTGFTLEGAGSPYGCEVGCDAVLIAKGSGGTLRVFKTLPRSLGLFNPKRMRPPASAKRFLGGGKVRLTVKIDGKRVARRTVAFG
jgi:hypothetical protein